MSTTNNKIKVGVVGGAGYTGGELIRLLLLHPHVEISFIHSKSNAGKKIYTVHHDLLGETELSFSDSLQQNIDVLFLCLGHGESLKFLQENKIADRVKIIDLSQDFRPGQNNNENKFIYGLTEAYKEKIKTAQYVANPGCFATCIQLALLPLAQHGLLNHDIHINATTGSTGAGQSLSATSHFSWRNNNLSTYKSFEHQHLKEIKKNLSSIQNNFNAAINFIPLRGNFTRGILASTYTRCDKSLEELQDVFKAYYKASPFVHLAPFTIDLKQVVNTNKAFIQIEKHGDQVLITSIIDNLLKGASGQAVQNMNVMFGIEETSGLKLKSIGF